MEMKYLRYFLVPVNDSYKTNKNKLTAVILIACVSKKIHQ